MKKIYTSTEQKLGLKAKKYNQNHNTLAKRAQTARLISTLPVCPGKHDRLETVSGPHTNAICKRHLGLGQF